jgi:subtilisin family serine protease
MRRYLQRSAPHRYDKGFFFMAAKRSTKTKAKGSVKARKVAPSVAGARELPLPRPNLVVYIHGIGNKPRESALKSQWDQALFDQNMGDATRMAYWVNRERYLVPEPDENEEATLKDVHSALYRSASVRPTALSPEESEEDFVASITHIASERKLLAQIGERLALGSREQRAPGGRHATTVGKKVLPFGEGLRESMTKWLTRKLLVDVYDFLFVETERQRMCDALAARLTQGSGPTIVVAHSQGTMIAYKTLFDLSKTRPDLEVPLLVTMGSPLGMQEIIDQMRRWTGVKKGKLPLPRCVKQWLNISERLDPVSIDRSLGDEYELGNDGAEELGLRVNPHWKNNPHSPTGYLSTSFVRTHVRDAVGRGFAQPTRPFVVARDLVSAMADAPDSRHPVLISMASADSAPPSTSPDTTSTKTRIIDRIQALVAKTAGAKSFDLAEIEVLRRFVAARLTREEIETLQAENASLTINKIWRNSVKRTLICESTKTLQATTAQLGYGALGHGIEWAVLDTGVNAHHPHFTTHRTVATQWDCTKRGAPVAVTLERPKPLDNDGHGTHVCGIIAGQYSSPSPQSKTPSRRFAGMAPEAKLHVFKVLDDHGEGQDSWIIKALDHIAQVNEVSGQLRIHGVNLSLGGPYDPEVFGCGHTPLCDELRRLWRQGVVVCVAAGNEGYAVLKSTSGDIDANMDLSIGDPANLDDCIAVGSVHKTNPHTYGVSFFSSRGPTADGRRKPDVVAPDERILSACHRLPNKTESIDDYYVEMGGTSMACPHVSGLIAAFLSVRREFIGYPDRVKALLLQNCTDLARDPYIQGYGLPNLTKMLLNS